MSTAKIIILMVVAILLIRMTIIGYRRLKYTQGIEERALKETTEAYGELDILDKVTYQGGLPDNPHAAHMKLALVKNGLVLFSESGYKFALPCPEWRNMDFFILRHQSKSPFKNVLFLGPWATTLFRDKFRHMITINYIDANNMDNNLLFEASDYPKFLRIQKAMKEHYRQFGKKKSGNDIGVKKLRRMEVGT